MKVSRATLCEIVVFGAVLQGLLDVSDLNLCESVASCSAVSSSESQSFKKLKLVSEESWRGEQQSGVAE